MGKTRSAGALAKLLQESPAGIYVLDEAREIVFANETLLHWLGVEESQLVGKRCDYRALVPDPAALAADLCPPPEAFSGERVQFVISRPDEKGTNQQRLAHAMPLADSTAG